MRNQTAYMYLSIIHIPFKKLFMEAAHENKADGQNMKYAYTR